MVQVFVSDSLFGLLVRLLFFGLLFRNLFRFLFSDSLAKIAPRSPQDWFWGGPGGTFWRCFGGPRRVRSKVPRPIFGLRNGTPIWAPFFLNFWPSWRPPGRPLGGPGGLLEPSWAVLGASWGLLGPSWARLGASRGRLGGSWGLPGAICRPCWIGSEAKPRKP